MRHLDMAQRHRLEGFIFSWVLPICFVLFSLTYFMSCNTHTINRGTVVGKYVTKGYSYWTTVYIDNFPHMQWHYVPDTYTIQVQGINAKGETVVENFSVDGSEYAQYKLNSNFVNND